MLWWNRCSCLQRPSLWSETGLNTPPLPLCLQGWTHTSGEETHLNFWCQPADELPTAGSVGHVCEGEGTRVLWAGGWYLKAACVRPPAPCRVKDIRQRPQVRPWGAGPQGGAGLRRRRRACGRERRGAGLLCVPPPSASYHVPSRWSWSSCPSSSSWWRCTGPAPPRRPGRTGWRWPPLPSSPRRSCPW